MNDNAFTQIIEKLNAYNPYSDKAKQALDNALQIYKYPQKVFTYGSTPFSTFSKVMPESLDKDKDFYCIGCSIGWICFYANYLFGIKSIGIDLHLDRLQYAQEIKDSLKLKDIFFISTDALNYNFDNVGCVWMSNLCFSDDISLNLFKILIAKADCCVSYKSFNYDSYVSNLLKNNEVICTAICAPTSWSNHSNFYVYQRTSTKRTATKKINTPKDDDVHIKNHSAEITQITDSMLIKLYKDKQISDITTVKENAMAVNAEKYLIGGKKESYFHTEAFNLRQIIVANYLHDSKFILEIGGYPKSVGDYLQHDNYLSIDPLYETTTNNKISSIYQEAKFNVPNKYDLVLLGFSLDIIDSNKLLEYAKNANRIILEYPEYYSPCKTKAYNFMLKLSHKILYNFLINLDQMEINVNTEHSWPPMYARRFIFLETTCPSIIQMK